jgi:taurine transport system permease protein
MSEFDAEVLVFPTVELPGEVDALTLPAAAIPQPPRPLPWRRWLAQPRLLSLATVVALLALWWLVTALQLVPPLFLPSPQAVLGKFHQVATVGYMDATLWQHLNASLARVAVALLAASLTAIPLGILLGRSRRARAIGDPIIEFYRPLPPLAYLPLIVIWFGIGELSKILLIYLAIFAPVVISTMAGVSAVAPDRLRAAQALGANPRQLLWYVVLPSALPDILTGMRIGLGTGWSTLVAAELIAATQGLGFMVQSAANFLVTDVVVLGILVIGAVAVGLELLIRALQRRLTPWQGKV